MKTIHKLSYLLLIILTSTSFAEDMIIEDETRNPLGCRNQGGKFLYNTMQIKTSKSGDQQSLFFVFNRLNRPVNLYQMLDDDASRSNLLNHKIYARQWAAIATDIPNLRYICSVEDAKSAYGKIVPCSDSLKICEFEYTRFGVNTRGNYWIVQSNSRNGAVAEVVNYGIIPQ